MAGLAQNRSGPGPRLRDLPPLALAGWGIRHAAAQAGAEGQQRDPAPARAATPAAGHYTALSRESGCRLAV